MDLSRLAEDFQKRFDEKMRAREIVLGASRRAIRSAANAIRAIHRGELEEARRLQDESRRALDDGESAAAGQPDRVFAGMLSDAQKEYAEAILTERIVQDAELPGPDEVGVELAPYLNGMAESIGECRRTILDLLRRGEVDPAERILAQMEDMYYLLVSMDYPDGITGHLRRSTDIARGIIEKTRGDLATSLQQRSLREALESHARNLKD